MTYYCGCCGQQLYDATENAGAFRVNSSFKSWDTNEKGVSRIRDTCDDCARKLIDATTVAAQAIVAANEERVAQRSAMVQEQRKVEAEIVADRMEFEKAWKQHRAAK